MFCNVQIIFFHGKIGVAVFFIGVAAATPYHPLDPPLGGALYQFVPTSIPSTSNQRLEYEYAGTRTTKAYTGCSVSRLLIISQAVRPYHKCFD